MSALLKQAIVDAKALKEAALQNAEQIILEKYSNEVKTAVSSLLEQEEEGGLDLGALTPDAGEEGAEGAPEGEEGAAPEGDEENKFEEDNLITPSYLEGDHIESRDGEFSFDTPDEGDTVKIDISPDEIAQFLSDAEKNDFGDVLDDRFNNFESDIDDDQIEVDLSQLGDLVDGEVEDMGIGDDEIEIDDEELQMVAEGYLEEETNLRVDAKVQPHGDVGSIAGPPPDELELAIDMALAQAMSDEAQEENEELRKTLDKLEESNRKLKKSQKVLKENNENYKRTVLLLKDKLEESVVTNAKLLYSNRVLLSVSLNERQKQQIVEALSNAHSVDEAKTIYETLQRSSAGSNSSAPQSLNEALSRNSGRSSILPRNKRKIEDNINENVMSRLQKLAGIK